MGIVSLTTDFGISDEYAGLMKAAVLSVDATATIVDITHGIGPQDLREAAFVIESAFRYFPKGTVHVVVVDPGVGTQRAIVGLSHAGHYFIAPDNGVLTMILDCGSPDKIVRLENAAFFLKRIGNTFHGRDIMAPAAAHLSRGVPLERLGPPISAGDLVIAEDFKPHAAAQGEMSGVVVAVDRFGNLITNIDVTQMRAGSENTGGSSGVRVLVGGRHTVDLLERYADAPPGAPLALIGSRGYVEIAVNGGSAHASLGAGKGDEVRIYPEGLKNTSDG